MNPPNVPIEFSNLELYDSNIVFSYASTQDFLTFKSSLQSNKMELSISTQLFYFRTI